MSLQNNRCRCKKKNISTTYVQKILISYPLKICTKRSSYNVERDNCTQLALSGRVRKSYIYSGIYYENAEGWQFFYERFFLQISRVPTLIHCNAIFFLSK
jgi:hypothetical protein